MRYKYHTRNYFHQSTDRDCGGSSDSEPYLPFKSRNANPIQLKATGDFDHPWIQRLPGSQPTTGKYFFLGERRIEHPACANPECQVVLKNSPETYTYAANFPVCLQKTEGKIRIIKFIAYWELESNRTDIQVTPDVLQVKDGLDKPPFNYISSYVVWNRDMFKDTVTGRMRTQGGSARESAGERVCVAGRGPLQRRARSACLYLTSVGIWEEKGCAEALRGGEMRFNLLGTRFDVMDLRARAEPWGDKGIQGNGWVLGVLVTWHWGSTALTRGDRVTAAVGLRRREMEGRAGGPLLAFPALKLTGFLAARRDCAGEIACNWMDAGGRCRIWSEACSLNTDANNSGSTLMSKLTPEVVARTRDEKESVVSGVPTCVPHDGHHGLLRHQIK
ncbi:hypothetical protein C8F04DRAFT_1180949 [Mycena alexandri]|uniref:Uncharacterized protein n=1 Tax=Mycena alexandri TaxID=1745969 RepID=A0AAD6T178_9AGAR|nr:hypothetical protein C8F04DRAFT_1180949 [Mycena alexandri]